MDNTDVFAHLVGSAREGRPFQVPTVFNRLLDTLDRFDDDLETEGAWRLSKATAKRLGETSDVQPPGGWRAFIALLAGTPWMKAERDRFVLQEMPGPDAPLRRMLVESFTQKLVPPTAAASTFIMLGIHPAWGVHLAHRMSNPDAEQTAKRRPRELFPEATHRLIARTVFDFMSVVIDGLVEVGPKRTLDPEAFGQFVFRAVRWSGTRARESADETTRGLEPFVARMDEDPDRISRMLASELVDEILVPAGAAERRDDDGIVVDVDLLERVDVGPEGHRGDAFEDFLAAATTEAAC